MWKDGSNVNKGARKKFFQRKLLFFRTNIKIIYHPRQSDTCREKYADIYGPKYKLIIKTPFKNKTGYTKEL